MRPQPSSQSVSVKDDYLHGIYTVKINMNSSGPSRCGSQGEARSPACVCSGQEQKFPCEVAPTPASPLEPAGMRRWGGGQGYSPVNSAACQKPAHSCPTPSQLHQAKAGPPSSGAPGAERLCRSSRIRGREEVALGTQWAKTRFQRHSGMGEATPLSLLQALCQLPHFTHLQPPATLSAAPRMAGFGSQRTQQNWHTISCQKEMVPTPAHQNLPSGRLSPLRASASASGSQHGPPRWGRGAATSKCSSSCWHPLGSRHHAGAGLRCTLPGFRAGVTGAGLREEQWASEREKEPDAAQSQRSRTPPLQVAVWPSQHQCVHSSPNNEAAPW